MMDLPERPADPEAIPSLAAFHAENVSIMLRSIADQRARERTAKARRFHRRCFCPDDCRCHREANPPCGCERHPRLVTTEGGAA